MAEIREQLPYSYLLCRLPNMHVFNSQRIVFFFRFKCLLRADSCLIRVALSQSAWRILWAETRLTVYRPLQVENSRDSTQSFLMGPIFHLTTYVWLAVCKTSARSIGWAKSLSCFKVHHGATVVRENHEICWKLAAPGSKWCSKSQIGFADANRPPRHDS